RMCPPTGTSGSMSQVPRDTFVAAARAISFVEPGWYALCVAVPSEWANSLGADAVEAMVENAHRTFEPLPAVGVYSRTGWVHFLAVLKCTGNNDLQASLSRSWL